MSAAFQAIREHGLGFPEAEEDFPWGHTALKVRGKTFAWLGDEDERFGMTVKLPVRAGRGARSGPYETLAR